MPRNPAAGLPARPPAVAAALPPAVATAARHALHLGIGVAVLRVQRAMVARHEASGRGADGGSARGAQRILAHLDDRRRMVSERLDAALDDRLGAVRSD